jgi:hypothetical protein
VTRLDRGAAATPKTRDALLSSAPLEIGAGLAARWKLAMAEQGRAVAGGWPGTISEARAHVVAYFDRELSLRKMPLLTIAELLAATQAVYARARRDWLSAQLSEKRRRRQRARQE